MRPRPSTTQHARVLALVAGLVLCASASGQTEAAAFSRAITLAPHITEMMFAAGAGDRIVGTVSSSDYPPPATAIPRVGDGMNVNVEKLLTLRPDSVLAWLPSGAAHTAAPILARMDIPLSYWPPQTLDDIPTQIRRLGRLFGSTTTANLAAHAMDNRLEALRERYSHRSPVSVFIELGGTPLYTIGSDPLLNDALAACGGVNIFAQAGIPAPQVSPENVLVRQPDVILVPDTDARQHAAAARWEQLGLRAGTDKRIYAIDPDMLFRPGPRLLDAMERLCPLLDKARGQ